jgi:hypothetical protein
MSNKPNVFKPKNFPTIFTGKPQCLLNEKDIDKLTELIRHGWFIKFGNNYHYRRFNIIEQIKDEQQTK